MFVIYWMAKIQSLITVQRIVLCINFLLNIQYHCLNTIRKMFKSSVQKTILLAILHFEDFYIWVIYKLSNIIELFQCPRKILTTYTAFYWNYIYHCFCVLFLKSRNIIFILLIEHLNLLFPLTILTHYFFLQIRIFCDFLFHLFLFLH